jgi:hypothetical protein
MQHLPVRDGGSYRDPHGFVFWLDGEPYRQINRSFEAEWLAMSSSGLLEKLIGQKHLENGERFLEVDSGP